MIGVGTSEKTLGKVGVVGAGTMGAGIAQCACLAGFETLLYDPEPKALAGAQRNIREGLERGAQRGRWTAAQADRAPTGFRLCESLDELKDCGLVIEAAPESLELKQELFVRLSELVADDAILATNTSSLSVAAIARKATRPERVVGMHFFNPAPLMPLVEIVAGERTGPEAIAAAHEVVERLGKEAIDARDVPGFLVNRCNRPFTLEALRLLEEGRAAVEAIDRICREAGFRMGPFELMDLIGIDVNYEVAKSFYEQSGHEPRWQPSVVQAKMIEAGRLGRKTGRGFYSYANGKRVSVDGEETTKAPVEEDLKQEVLDRIVCQLVNEASFALEQGVGSAADIDKGMQLGLNYPRGPLEWGDELGIDHVLAVLDCLAAGTHRRRYRASALLRRMVVEGRLGRAAGSGFFEYAR